MANYITQLLGGI